MSEIQIKRTEIQIKNTETKTKAFLIKGGQSEFSPHTSYHQKKSERIIIMNAN
jgi:hypothetical protein